MIATLKNAIMKRGDYLDVILLPKQGGDEETVSLYIKFNKLANFYIIVISFHKQDYPLVYKFK